MRIFGPLYDRALLWAKHRYARFYLAALSFAESSFFPVPPDVMLAPMVLAERKKGWNLAAICTLASVLGGVLGYVIGAFFFDALAPFLTRHGYMDTINQAQSYFETYGFWFILVAGFSPIPYKLFTIAAGLLGMPLLPFLAGSIIGRGARFFLVAGLIILGGDRMANSLRKYVETIGWIVTGLVAVAVIWLTLVRQ